MHKILNVFMFKHLNFLTDIRNIFIDSINLKEIVKFQILNSKK